MKIKVYNENGVVKITKISASGLEQALFSNLKNGELVEINVEVTNLSIVANKYSITE